ncbi:hypothetical protein FKP32DRAFT_1554460, partial [Trametes sanguinea]
DVAYTTIPFMDLASLRVLAGTSTVTRRWVTVFLDNEYNHALRTFVHDPKALRAVLRLVGGVISGSFALAFLVRNGPHPFEPNDLDIYIPRHRCQRLLQYLTTREGYQTVDDPPSQYDDNPALLSVYTLENNARRIQLVESRTSSSLYPLSYFWASHVVNFLTADNYCMAYPRLTLNQLGVLN